MKFIKRKSAVKPITGSIVDTTNIDDKSTNTYSANIIDKFNSYSTEETFTGKYWIDGKKIYRKVVDLGLIGTESADKSYTIGTNIEKLIECKAKLISSTNTSCDLIPVENDDVYAKVNTYSKNGVINITLKRSGIGHYSDRNLVVTVEYTKTTD